MATWVEIHASDGTGAAYLNLDQLVRLEVRPYRVTAEGIISRVFVWTSGMPLGQDGYCVRLDESAPWNNEADVERLVRLLKVVDDERA